MSDNPELSVEARLIDYISANLNTITRNIQQFETTSSSSFGNFSNSADKANDAATDLAGSIGNNLTRSVIGLATGFAGVASIGMFIGKMQEAYKEAKKLQEANIQLTAAIGYYSSGLNEQAMQLSKVHNMEETSIIQAQERLGNYIKEEATIKALIPAIMNLAAAKGIDLARAADIVGRSIEGNEKTMGRYGITMEGAAGSAEKAASALKGLNEKFLGQREALDETVSGWDRLWKKASDYLKVVGSIFTAETQQEKYEQDKKMLADPKRVKYGDPEIIKEAQDFVTKFEADNNKKRADAEEELKKETAKRTEEETEKLREQYWKMTDDGKLKLLNKEMTDEIESHKNNEEQITLIKLRYAKERADLLASQGKKDFENAGTGVKKAINTSPAAGYQKGTNSFNVDNAYDSGMAFLKTVDISKTEEQLKQAEDMRKRFLDFQEQMNGRQVNLNNMNDKEQETFYATLLKENQAYYDQSLITYEEYLKNKDILSGKEISIQDKKRKVILEITAAETAAMMTGYDKGRMDMKKGMKAMLDLAVDYIEKWALAAVAANVAKNETAYGYIAGTVLSIAETAAIVAGAAVAKGGIDSFAIGTRDAPGGLAYVHKDELINLPAHSQVYTKQETKQMMGDTVHFNFYGNTDSTTVDNIQSMLIEANRTGKLKRFKSIMQND
jgi:hypothetical protein